MSEIMEDVVYLSQEIGPRPAGTEEEQQAALYIADQMQKRSGFAASIEDFACSSHPGLVEAILFGLPALFSLLAVLFQPLVIPAFFVCLACAILYVFELIDRPFLSRLFERGISQNVVARYVPGKQADARGRKVVLVANYDSTKVSGELNGALFSMYPLFTKASTVGLLALPVIWLIRSLFLLHSSGMAVLFFNLLAAIALILALVPVARFFMHRFATYNEAANNNAAGVASLLEIARLISAGSYSEEELAEQEAARVHDAEAAQAAGVVVEGAELEYEAEPAQTEQERLAAAKAAVAALTGKPLRSYENEDVVSLITVTTEDGTEEQVPDYGEYAYSEEDNSAEKASAPEAAASAHFTTTPVTERAVNVEPERLDEEAFAAAPVQPIAQSAPASAYAPVANEPTWFTVGRAKAAKPNAADEVPARRGRYADALNAAVAASRKHFEQAATMLDEGSLESISRYQRGIQMGEEPAASQSERDLFTLRSDEPVGGAAADETVELPVEELAIEEEQAVEEVFVAEAVAEDEVAEEYEAVEDVEPVAEEVPEEEPEVEVEVVAEEALEEADEEPVLEVVEEADEAVPAEMVVEEQVEPAEVAQEEIEAEPVPAAAAQEQRAATARIREGVAESLPTIEREPEQQPAPLESVMLSYEEVELLDGVTTAMPPIDVASLRAEVPAAESADALHDFSRIGSAPTRTRNRVKPPYFDNDTEDEPETPNQGEQLVLDVDDEPEADEIFDEIDAEAQRRAAEEASRRAVAEKRAALRSAIPTLSGEYTPSEFDEDAGQTENVEVSKTGSFAAVGSATAINPVGDELVADLDPEDRYVEDADDSSFDDNVTETGAFAGPDYMDMPESRIGRFFNRFRRKAQEEEPSTSEWLDVDEGFSAPAAGAARGGWESFRTEPDDEYDDVELYEEEDEEETEVESPTMVLPEIGSENANERPWHGGAFSRLRALVQGGEDDAELYDDYDEDMYDEDVYDEDLSEEPGGEVPAEEADGPEGETEVLAPVDEADFVSNVDELEVSNEDVVATAQEAELELDAETDFDVEDVADDDVADDEVVAAEAPVKKGRASKALGALKAVGSKVGKSSKEPKSSKVTRSASSDVDDDEKPKSAFDAEAEAARIAEEASLVYNFRNPDINTEVWFVALGSECAGNGGIKAFLDEHAEELRGAIIVNLEATGAGTLSYIEEEGHVITRRPSSRLKRFLRKATEVTGISTGTERIDWRESAASVAMRRGMQAMTLVGMEGGKPALLGQGDDVLENVDEALIAENAQFVLELIKNI